MNSTINFIPKEGKRGAYIIFYEPQTASLKITVSDNKLKELYEDIKEYLDSLPKED